MNEVKDIRAALRRAEKYLDSNQWFSAEQSIWEALAHLHGYQRDLAIASRTEQTLNKLCLPDIT